MLAVLTELLRELAADGHELAGEGGKRRTAMCVKQATACAYVLTEALQGNLTLDNAQALLRGRCVLVLGRILTCEESSLSLQLEQDTARRRFKMTCPVQVPPMATPTPLVFHPPGASVRVLSGAVGTAGRRRGAQP